MSELENSQAEAIDRALSCWRQGDVSIGGKFEFLHLANLSQPLSPASVLAAKQKDTKSLRTGITTVSDTVEGVAVLTQTCDIARSCLDRSFVEVVPLVQRDDEFVEQVRRLHRPAFAYIPATATSLLVANLSRIQIVEKAIVANWKRTPGWTTDYEIRNFALAISRKWSRFAFPDDFVNFVDKFRRHLTKQHNRQSDEALHLRALSEIRVQASPSWNHENVELMWWFIKDCDPDGCLTDWDYFATRWTQMFDTSGRFQFEGFVVCGLDDMTALEYVESVRLDLDRLSVN